jgi:tRNA pseudouridine55 synthase
MTSRDAVDWVQRLAGRTKIGHAGTLDPIARGVLVICLGGATRLVDYIHRFPKSYTATFLLGRGSPTDDVEGDVTELESPPRPSLEDIQQAAASLTGEIQQRPPDYSAVKVRGRRAYALARAGRTVELRAKTVRVDSTDVVSYAYPELVLKITCGAGTYIRALGRDLAESLGTAAVMSALTRTSIGNFRREDACELEELTQENLEERLLPPLRALEGMPVLELSNEEIARIRNGLTIPHELPTGEDEFAGVDHRGRLVALLTRRGVVDWRDTSGVGPKLNLPADDSLHGSSD